MWGFLSVTNHKFEALESESERFMWISGCRILKEKCMDESNSFFVS